MQITFTVPDAQVSRIVDAMWGLYSVPRDENKQPEFTPDQWAKERIRRWIRDQVMRWEREKAIKSIVSTTLPDDDLVT